MNTNRILLGAALLIALLCSAAAAAAELVELRPLAQPDRPVPIKVVEPVGIPSQYRDAIIRIAFSLDAAGVPTGIKVWDSDDAALTDSLVFALAQWRFTPARVNGVAVERNVILPLQLSANGPGRPLDPHVGAVPVATVRTGRTPAAPDRNEHEALVHVNVVTRDGVEFVLDGMSEAEVRKTLGQPKIIAGNVWAYSKFDAESEDARRHGCDTVLISFQNHRVATLALVNERALNFAAIQLRNEPGYVERVLQGMHRETNVTLR